MIKQVQRMPTEGNFIAVWRASSGEMFCQSFHADFLAYNGFEDFFENEHGYNAAFFNRVGAEFYVAE